MITRYYFTDALTALFWVKRFNIRIPGKRGVPYRQSTLGAMSAGNMNVIPPERLYVHQEDAHIVTEMPQAIILCLGLLGMWPKDEVWPI